MGRINLAPLRVRKRALANLESSGTKVRPVWLDVIGDIPPAQIFTRQQPIPHSFTQTRTRSLPNGSIQQYTAVISSKKSKSSKSSRQFAPLPIRYEEDQLRKQFFKDHPWELARPRIVVETTGNQYKNVNWSTGVQQPGLPLSGESVIQRQLWLLNNVADMTMDSAYDIARREFYALRRQEETRRRVAREEAIHMGAEPARSVLQWSMEVENKQYNDWEAWSRSQVAEQMQRSAAFSGEISPADEAVLLENEDEAQPQAATNSRIGRSIGGQGPPPADKGRRRTPILNRSSA